MQCDVHYYEDGNVRLTTRKSVNPTTISPSSSSVSSASTANATAGEIVKAIANLEGKYQKDLNHGFAKLSEGEFKALRRQLPVTRQKVEWEKVGGYRVSSTSRSCDISDPSALRLYAFGLPILPRPGEVEWRKDIPLRIFTTEFWETQILIQVST